MSIETCTMTMGELRGMAMKADPKKASIYEDLYSFTDISASEYVQKL